MQQHGLVSNRLSEPHGLWAEGFRQRGVKAPLVLRPAVEEVASAQQDMGLLDVRDPVPGIERKRSLETGKRLVVAPKLGQGRRVGVQVTGILRFGSDGGGEA